MKKNVLSFIRRHGEHLTPVQLSQILKTPLNEIQKHIFDLKSMGKVQEVTLDELLFLEK